VNIICKICADSETLKTLLLNLDHSWVITDIQWMVHWGVLVQNWHLHFKQVWRGSAPSLMPYSSSFTKHSCKSLTESSCKSTKGKEDNKGPNYADQQSPCKFECSDPLFSFVIWSTQFAQTTNFSVNLSLVAQYFHLKTGVPSLLLRPQSSPNWGVWSPLEYSVCCFNSKLWLTEDHGPH
jgi:hypothetical protein